MLAFVFLYTNIYGDIILHVYCIKSSIMTKNATLRLGSLDPNSNFLYKMGPDFLERQYLVQLKARTRIQKTRTI